MRDAGGYAIILVNLAASLTLQQINTFLSFITVIIALLTAIIKFMNELSKRNEIKNRKNFLVWKTFTDKSLNHSQQKPENRFG